MFRRMSPYRVYLVLSAATAFFITLYGTLSAVYRFQSAGLSPLQLILVGTVLELSVFLFEVPTGIVADLSGRRRSVIIGIFLMGLGFMLEGLFPLFSTILLAQVVWGIGVTFRSGAEDAWIADELGEARVEEAFLRATQLGQLASLVGIAVTVALGSIYLGLPAIVGGLGFACVGVFLLIFMREEGYTPTAREGPTFAAMRDLLRTGLGYVRRSPVLLTILAVTAIMGASSETFDRLWEARLLRIGLPDLGALPDIGWFGLISAGAMGLAALATEGARRLGKRGPDFTVKVLATLNTLLMLFVIGFGAAGNFPLALAFYWAAYLLRTVNGPLYAAWLNSYLEPGSRATVFSLNNQADAFGQVAGGPVLGLIANLSLRGAFGISGLLLLPATLLYLGLLRRRAVLGVSEEVS